MTLLPPLTEPTTQVSTDDTVPQLWEIVVVEVTRRTYTVEAADCDEASERYLDKHHEHVTEQTLSFEVQSIEPVQEV